MIHFGGLRGRALRKNYMSVVFESTGPQDRAISKAVFRDLDEDSESFTYRSPQGLLYLTQFAQPALTVMAKASFDVLKSKGLTQEQSFAGHSLGEYAALSSLADIMPIEQLVSVVFYRGLTMQVSVDRDSMGRTNYAMCAFNPSRVSKSNQIPLPRLRDYSKLTPKLEFDEEALRCVVDTIQRETEWLLEIVNFNIQDLQYTCTGDVSRH